MVKRLSDRLLLYADEAEVLCGARCCKINSIRNDCRFSGSGSMMNRMSFSETIFLFFLALVIFGPKKLPEIARQVGKALNEFRRASNEFKAQIEQEISNLEVENRRTILPPSPPPEGIASRTLNAASDQTTPAQPPATLA